MCVCVFFPFIVDIKFVGRTSRGHRIQPFLSLVDREVEFCVLTILIVLQALDIFIFAF